MRYQNISGERRIWPWLKNADTGRTLELDPGESAEIDGDIHSPYLAPVQAETPEASAPEPEPGPETEPKRSRRKAKTDEKD